MRTLNGGRHSEYQSDRQKALALDILKKTKCDGLRRGSPTLTRELDEFT